MKLENPKKGRKRFIPLLLIATLFASAPVALTATGMAPAASASATVPSVKGEAKCNPETSQYDIVWTVSGDANVPNETATIVSQSRATSPTLEGATVKNTSSVTGSESVSEAGTYTLEVKVQWTNHAKGDLVTQQGSVTVSGPCATPPAPPTQTVTCDVISADYNRPLTNGDHINATITPPGSQVNMYVDQNIAGGASYNGQNNLGLRWKILGVEQTPIPLTLEQVMAGVITLPYGAELLKTQSGWTVSFVQTNETDTWPEFDCNPTKEEAVATVSVKTAETCDTSSTVEATLTNATLADGQVLDQTVGDHTVIFQADNGALFNDGQETFSVTYTIKPADPSLCITVITEFEPVRATDECGVENDYLDIPRDTYNVTYTIVNDTRVDGVGSVTVEATAKTGFSFDKDAVTSWTFEFTNEACTVIITEFAAASSVDECGIANDKLNIPKDTEQVAYKVTDNRVNGVGTAVVEATAKTGFSFDKDAVTSWTFEFTNEACDTTPPVEPPTVITEFEPVRGTDNCGVDNDYLDIPRDTYNVTYTITNDTRVDGVGSVTVEATAKIGFKMPKDAVTSWTFEFTNEACESTPPTEPPVTEPPVVIPPVVTPPTTEPPVVTPPKPTETPVPTETPKPTPTPTETSTPTPVPPAIINPPAAKPPVAIAAVKPAPPTTLASTGTEAGTIGTLAALMLAAGALIVGTEVVKRRRRKATNG